MANLLSAHRDLANAAHRAEVARAVGRGRRAGAARQDRGRDVRGRRRRRDQGAVDRLHQPGAVDARPGHGAPRARALPSSWWCRKPSPPPPPAPTPTCCCRPPPGARRTARSPTASAASAACGRPSPRPARRATTGRSSCDFARRLKRGSARAPGDGSSLFPYAGRRGRSGTSTARSTRGRDLDITGLSYARARGSARSNGRCPKARPQGRTRLYEDGVFPTADGRARFVDAPYKPVAEPRDARYPVRPHHRPPARPVARHEPHRHARPAVRPRARAGGARCMPQDMARPAWPTATWCTSPRAAARSCCRRRPAPPRRRRRPSSPCTGARSSCRAARAAAGERRALAGVNALTSRPSARTRSSPNSSTRRSRSLKAELPWRLLGARLAAGRPGARGARGSLRR